MIGILAGKEDLFVSFLLHIFVPISKSVVSMMTLTELLGFHEVRVITTGLNKYLV
jgi:hypothetical protein